MGLYYIVKLRNTEVIVIMDLLRLIHSHYLLQTNCYFTAIEDTNDVIYAYSDSLYNTIWHHAYIKDKTENLDDLLKVIETKINDAYIYFDAPVSDLCVAKLASFRYEFSDLETWMIFSNNGIDRRCDETLKLKKVELHEELIEFLEICREEFSAEHALAIEKEFGERVDFKKFCHFLLRDGLKTVGIASIYSDGSFTAIHNVAVRKKEQCKGYGTNLLLLLLQQISGSNNIIFLQCDGWDFKKNIISYQVGFYKKLGFEEVLTRVGFKKGVKTY